MIGARLSLPADPQKSNTSMKTREKIESKARESLLKPAEGSHRESFSGPRSDDVAELLEELRVRQIELEIQNTELREAQERLSESRNRYYDLYDFAPVGYITTSTSGVVLECNLAVADMFGVVRSRLIGKLFEGFVFPSDLYVLQAHRRRLFDNRRKDVCELRLMKKNRAFFCRIESVCSPGRDGEKESFRSALTDITELKKKEDGLRKANERFEALAENARDIISRRDTDLRCAYINPAVEAHLGMPRSAFLGKTPEETGETTPFPCRLHQAYIEVLHAGHEKTFEFEIETPKGFKTFHSIVIPEKSGEGDVESILTVSRDITSLKNIQRELEHMVHERSMELTRIKSALEAQIERRIKFEEALKSSTGKIIAEAEKRRLLSRRLVRMLEEDRRNMAMALHDQLGQLLTALNMDLETILSDAEPGGLEALVGKARRKVREALGFVRNISHELRPSALESLRLVPSLTSLVEAIRESYRIPVSFFHSEIPRNLGNDKALALFRIAQEATTNALKHADAGNLFINRISREGTLYLTVEDDGKGFDQKTIIVGPRGALGIEIMKERAVDAGGQLKIETRPGSGTQVIAEMPV